MLAGPIKIVPSEFQLSAKWLSLNVPPLVCFHTPMQKLLVIGGRPEFIISVPSLCQVAYPSSITAPSGMPVLPLETNFIFHRPTIAARSESSSDSLPLWPEISKSDGCLNLPSGWSDFCRGRLGAGVTSSVEYPQPVFAPAK